MLILECAVLLDGTKTQHKEKHLEFPKLHTLYRILKIVAKNAKCTNIKKNVKVPFTVPLRTNFVPILDFRQNISLQH